MIERMRHLAQTIHQAHHGKQADSWETCRQHACVELRKLIEQAQALPPPPRKWGRFPSVAVWLQGKAGVLPHDLPDEIVRSSVPGITWGHTFGSWGTAQKYIREAIRDGWIVYVYEVWNG